MKFSEITQCISKCLKSRNEKIIRLSHTLEQGLEQTFLDIPQEIWYKYPTNGEKELKKILAKKKIKAVRPFPDSYRDKNYTYEPLVWKIIADGHLTRMRKQPVFFTYRNSTNLDDICREYGFIQFMPDYQLFKKIQYKSHLEKYGVSKENGLIPFIEKNIHKTSYDSISKKFGEKFVIQYSFNKYGNNTTGGLDTHIIKNKNDYLQLLKNEKRTDKAKISKYIRGIEAAMNIVVTKNGAIVTDLFTQVIGERELGDSDLFFNGANMTEKFPIQVEEKATKIARELGKHLYKNGFKGFCGIDFIVEESTDNVYVVEINPRFTGSFHFHTLVDVCNDNLPLIAFHIAEYLGCLPGKFPIEEYEQKVKSTLKGGFFYILNREGRTMQVSQAPKMGLYKYENGEVVFIKESISLADCKSDCCFLIQNICPLFRNKMYMRPDDPLCTIHTLGKAFQKNKLTPKYKKIRKKVYEMFSFVEEDTYNSDYPFTLTG